MIIGPGSRLLNAQFSRDVRLSGNRVSRIQVNTNNLLNMVNYGAIDTVVNSPTFGQVLSVRGDAVDRSSISGSGSEMLTTSDQQTPMTLLHRARLIARGRRCR